MWRKSLATVLSSGAAATSPNGTRPTRSGTGPGLHWQPADGEHGYGAADMGTANDERRTTVHGKPQASTSRSRSRRRNHQRPHLQAVPTGRVQRAGNPASGAAPLGTRRGLPAGGPAHRHRPRGPHRHRNVRQGFDRRVGRGRSAAGCAAHRSLVANDLRIGTAQIPPRK